MVGIKDMEMPKSCAKCPYVKKEEYACKCKLTNSYSLNAICVPYDKKDCPLVEVQERKIGKWIGEKGYPICGKCGCDVIGEYISKTEYAEMYKSMKFCPNCGAEMRGTEND